jgi:glycerol-3-phosphate O-acyltransferase
MENFRKRITYPYIFDHKPGFFLGWFLYRLFKKVNLDKNIKSSLKDMHRRGVIVYAVKYRGLLDNLLYHYTLRQRRLPYPKIMFDQNMSLVLPISRLFKIIISYISSFVRYGKIPGPYETEFYRSMLKEKTVGLVSLIDPAGFIRKFIHSQKEHLSFLVEIQKESDVPIFIVPQLIMFKRTPEKESSNLFNILFGYRDNPGTIRKIILFFRHYRDTFIDFGEPINLLSYLQGQPASKTLDEITGEIKQDLIEKIDRQKRVFLGPIMKSRQQLKEIVLKDKDITALIEKMADGDNIKLKGKRKKAGEYFDEIAADYSSSYIYSLRIALKWLWKRIFEGIDTVQTDLAELREWARKGPLIYIPSHKSHIDYLALNYVLFENNMHIPRIAAGQNLAFWPMGHIFRKCGAFFIRRSFKGAKLYSEVFARYVKSLIEEGHHIQFYIEGGRSRNGKLVLPKIGFLSIVLKAYEEGFCKDLIFVPTSIIYDRIIEGKSYLKEVGGGLKEKENFKQILKARRFLKRRYGKIYIRFDKPFSLNEYLNEKKLGIDEIHHNLAFHLVDSINNVSLVTPLALVSTAILSNHRKGFYVSELEKSIELLMDFIAINKIPVSDSMNDPLKATRETMDLLINWKVLDYMEDTFEPEERFYYVEDDKKLELEYYKNSIIHFFINHSLIAISLLSCKEEEIAIEALIKEYQFLKEIFELEFIFNNRQDQDQGLADIIDYFSDRGYISQIPDDKGYKITKQGFDELPMWGSLIKTFIESYWIATMALGQNKDKIPTGENLLKHMDYLGKKYYKLGVVEHIGALSRLNFKNAVTLINKQTMTAHPSDKKKLDHDKLSELSRRLHDLSQCGR